MVPLRLRPRRNRGRRLLGRDAEHSPGRVERQHRGAARRAHANGCFPLPSRRSDAMKRLTRRHFMTGIGGVSVALPLMHGLGGVSRAQELTFPKRFIVFYTPNG